MVEAPTQRNRYIVDTVVLSNAILLPKNPTPTAKLARARKGKALVGLKVDKAVSFLKEIRQDPDTIIIKIYELLSGFLIH